MDYFYENKMLWPHYCQFFEDGVEMHQDSSATSTETIEGTDVSVAVSSKAKAASKIFVCNDCAYTRKDMKSLLVGR